MNKEVDNYIARLESPQKEICDKLRQIILKTFPNIEEKMKWGVPTYDGGKFYTVALSNHVNLGVSIKGLSRENLAVLEGSGKTMRHIKINSVNDMDANKIVRLLRLVKEK